ncbi:S8 family peptidase [Pseudoalteromonas rubra]|nr:S8 family serine peptidase [Pseudoalteromonas rubra]
MFKRSLGVVLSCLCMTEAIATPELDNLALSAQLNKSYQALKSQTQQGKNVRVIARLKPIQQPATYVYRTEKFAKQNQIQARLSEANSELQTLGVKVSRSLPRWGYMTMEVSDTELDALAHSGLFDMISEDTANSAHISASSQHVNAQEAHDMGYSGAGQTIVVFDSGFDVDHPFLGGRVIQEACFSSNATNHDTSLCANGATTGIGPGSASICENEDLNECHHGTHVAGIAAGALTGFSGIAPEANIVGVQVFTRVNHTAICEESTPCLRTYDTDLLAAFNWVIEEVERGALENVATLNLSLGGGEFAGACDDRLLAAPIEELREMGIATVISAGNDYFNGSVGQPGCVSDAITVGGTLRTEDDLLIVRDANGVIDWGTNMSEQVDVLAPGRRIESSIPGPTFETMSGTSMSAPHVAGAIAVLKQINPDASVDRIEQVLESTGVNVTDPRNGITRPRIDVHAAALALEGKPIAALDQPSYSVMVGTQTTFTAKASSDPNGHTLSYGWDFDGNGVVDEETSQSSAQHTYENIGSYQMKLTVSNNERSDTTQASVTVYDPVLLSIIISSSLL